MSSLRRRYRNFKKAKANPYAGRGLDKFALVTAELQAKREKLSAELDTPLSMVKFAIGTHNKWVPIVLSRSTRKENRLPKKKSGALVNEEKLALNSRARKGCLRKEGGAAPGMINKEKLHLSGLASENGANGRDCTKDHVAQTGPIANAVHVASNVRGQESPLSGSSTVNTHTLGDFIGEGAFLGDGLHKEGAFHTDIASNKDRLQVDALMQKRDITIGTSIGLGRVSGEIIEFFSPDSEAGHIPSHKEAADAVLQGQNLKKMIGAIAGVPWIISKASTIARSIVFLKWHTRSVASEGKTSSPNKESLRDIEEFHTAEISVSLSAPSLDKAVALPLPSPPASLKIPSISVTSEQGDAVETMEAVRAPRQETADRQHRKCKVKGLLKIHSAPSTPRDSRQPKSPFTAESTVSKAMVVSDRATNAGIKEDKLLAPRITNAHVIPVKRRILKASAADTGKESARRAGHALAAAGLVLSLSGLAMGYVSAIIGVVCWWYVLPSLRKAVGDKPMVRSHHPSHANNRNLRATTNEGKDEKTSKEVAGGICDLFSQEYKKKVIMEGLLDRGRRSNA